MNHEIETAGRETLTGGVAIVRTLRACGIRFAFGVASGKLSPLFRAVGDEPAIDYVGVRHEATAGFMATGIAAGLGEPALCLGETGPGGLNLLSALGGAAANSLPLIAITSSNPSAIILPDLGAFSSTDNAKLFAGLVKLSITAREARRLPELVRQAYRSATTGRPGPVHIDVPADVLAEVCSYATAELEFRPQPPALPAPDAVALGQAVDLLRAARRPLIVAGGGLVASGGCDELRALVERHGIPVITTQMGLGALADDDPMLVGQGGLVGGPAVLTALREADMIIALGCRFSSWMWPDGPPRWSTNSDAAVVAVNIDPDAIGRTMPVAVGLVSDAGAFVARLATALESAPLSGMPDWNGRLFAERDRHHAVLNAMAASQAENNIMHPATLARAIGKRAGTGGIAVYDGGHTTFWSNDLTPTAAPRTRLHEPGMTHLGFGLPWAMALKRARPDTAVWCITGDGAFGFTLQELDTARREGLAVIVVIHNNASFGVIGHSQRRAGFSIGTDLSGTNYAAIARGFGCYGAEVTDVDGFNAAVDEAIATGLPAVIDARVSFVPHPMMPAFGRSTSAPR